MAKLQDDSAVDFIWETIQKMSLGERYAFRRNYETKKIPLYVTLYDAIIVEKEYNETFLKKKLAKVMPAAKFVYHKHILLQKLCESNVQFISKQDDEMNVLQLLQIVRMLRLKGQLILANKYLNKAFAIVSKNEFASFMRLCLDELLRIELFNKNNNTMIELTNTIQKTKHLFDKYNDVIIAQTIYLKLIGIRRNNNVVNRPDEKEELKEIRKEINLIKAPQDNNLNNANFYYMGLGTLEYLEGNFSTAFAILKKNLDHWQNGIISIQSDPEYYFDALSLYTDIGILLNQFDTVFEAINHPCHDMPLSDYANATLGIVRFRCKNRIWNKTAEFEKVDALINQIKPELETWLNHCTIETKTLLMASISISCFTLKNYSDSLYYIKQSIFTFNKATRKEFQSFVYLLGVLIAYEQNNAMVFDNTYHSAYIHFYKSKNALSFEKIILQLLKQTYAKKGTKASIEKMKTVLAQLDANSQDYIQQYIFNFFNFPRWIRSKIEKKNYADMVKIEIGKK
jgi:tetratricopeptide (TPR) repeat protein